MLIASGIYITYIDSAYGAIRLSIAKKDALTHSLASTTDAQQAIEHLAAVASGFPPDYEVKLRTVLPESIDTTRLIVEVNAMAVRNGLQISTPTIGVIENSKKSPLPYIRHTISFTVRAPYSKFREYVRDLEGNLSLRDMTSLSFNSQETSEDVISYKSPELVPRSYTVQLITYSIH